MSSSVPPTSVPSDPATPPVGPTTPPAANPQPAQPPIVAGGDNLVVSKQVSLPAELVRAGLGGFNAGLISFIGVFSQTKISDLKALAAAGITAGGVALVFFSQSFNSWYQQRYN